MNEPVDKDMLLDKLRVDSRDAPSVLSPKEVAQFFEKSTSWVYKNWKELGGKKLGGSLFFPRKGDLYEHIFSKREGVEIRLHPEGNQVHGKLVQNQKDGEKGRGKKKGGDRKAGKRHNDYNRHGLFGAGE